MSIRESLHPLSCGDVKLEHEVPSDYLQVPFCLVLDDSEFCSSFCWVMAGLGPECVKWGRDVMTVLYDTEPTWEQLHQHWHGFDYVAQVSSFISSIRSTEEIHKMPTLRMMECIEKRGTSHRSLGLKDRAKIVWKEWSEKKIDHLIKHGWIDKYSPDTFAAIGKCYEARSKIFN